MGPLLLRAHCCCCRHAGCRCSLRQAKAARESYYRLNKQLMNTTKQCIDHSKRGTHRCAKKTPRLRKGCAGHPVSRSIRSTSSAPIVWQPNCAHWQRQRGGCGRGGHGHGEGCQHPRVGGPQPGGWPQRRAGACRSHLLHQLAVVDLAVRATSHVPGCHHLGQRRCGRCGVGRQAAAAAAAMA